MYYVYSTSVIFSMFMYVYVGNECGMSVRKRIGVHVVTERT